MKNITRDKKIVVVALKIFLIVLLMSSLSFNNGCNVKNDKEKLHVYNWGIYIDESVIRKFEDKYNVNVVYDTFDTNQEMYTIVKENARQYDVLCPSNYMIEKMIKENMLLSVDMKNELKNYGALDKKVMDKMKEFDEENTYAIPYALSTLGIIYNKTLLDKKGLEYPTSWASLWNEKYANEIIMQDEMRDLMLVGLKKNNFSTNTRNEEEIEKATNDLIEQKPLVNSYVIDQARDKMVSGEGAIAVMYSGEVEYISTEGKNFEYEYIIPKEGGGFVIDAWVIPSNAPNKELAKKWIDFMLDENISLLNYDYMHYGIANLKTIELIKKRDGEKELEKNYIFFDTNDMDRLEMYKDLDEYNDVYLNAYKRIKSH